MLLEYQLPEYLFEFIALRYPEKFSVAALANAEQRMNPTRHSKAGKEAAELS